jgi:hypothetical protein
VGSGYNPPLPGQGIEPSAPAPERVTPPFNREALGGEIEQRTEVPVPELRVAPPPPMPGGNAPVRPPSPPPTHAPEKPKGSVRLPIKTAPDGTPIKEGAAEDGRRKGLEVRMNRINAEFEKTGGPTRDRSELGRDFDNAHYHRE